MHRANLGFFPSLVCVCVCVFSQLVSRPEDGVKYVLLSHPSPGISLALQKGNTRLKQHYCETGFHAKRPSPSVPHIFFSTLSIFGFHCVCFSSFCPQRHPLIFSFGLFLPSFSPSSSVPLTLHMIPSLRLFFLSHILSPGCNIVGSL